MAGVDVGGGGGKRTVNHDINMVPFIDLLMVTIAFLLITAVWVTHSRINANAQVPGIGKGPVEPGAVEKVLHLYAHGDEFVLTWKQAGTVISEARLPRADQSAASEPHYADLADKVSAQWKLHGGHQDPSDRTLDRCVFHSDNHMPFREIVAVMDALYEAKRGMRMPDGNVRQVPAFNMAFAAR